MRCLQNFGRVLTLPQLLDFAQKGFHELALTFGNFWVACFKDGQVSVKETFQSRFRFRKQLRTSHPESRTRQ
jgi:hypothetical protein